MPRQLATIQTIKELLPIEGADNIEVATFKNIGWQCVVKKGEFNVGEACVYHEIDSLLPSTNPAYAFLGERDNVKTIIVEDDKGNDIEVSGYRLRTVKLRKTLSQGLALPVNTLLPNRNFKDGDDVSSILGIYKYEKPEAANSSDTPKLKEWQKSLLRLPFIGKYFKKIFLPMTTRSFPAWIFKTDETRCIDEGTIVITEDGDKTIKEICDTNYRGKVLSFNIDTSEKEWQKITDSVISSKSDDWYEILLDNGKTLKVTGNHKIWAENEKKYKLVSELTTKDSVLLNI
jgi:RNA ligase (TIGR02306 family)